MGFRSHVGQTRLTVYKLSPHSRYKTQYCITTRRGKGWGFPGRGFEGGFCKIFKFVGTNCHHSHTHTLTHSHTLTFTQSNISHKILKDMFSRFWLWSKVMVWECAKACCGRDSHHSHIHSFSGYTRWCFKIVLCSIERRRIRAWPLVRLVTANLNLLLI